MKTSSPNLPSRTPRPCRDADEGQQAFTRLDLLTVLITVLAIGGFVLPLLANTRQRAEQAACANNLRQIGRAVHLWANDHGYLTPDRINVVDGGMETMSGETASQYFSCLKAELGTPKLLVCPSDTNNVVAKDFSSLRDNAVSYFVGLHAYPDEPHSWVSGDRNLRLTWRPAYCGQLWNTREVQRNDPLLQWGNSLLYPGGNVLHYPSGNILFNSGSVQQLSKQGLQNAVIKHTSGTTGAHSAVIHLLIPEPPFP